MVSEAPRQEYFMKMGVASSVNAPDSVVRVTPKFPVHLSLRR